MRNKKSSYKIIVQNLTDKGARMWTGFHLAQNRKYREQ